MISPFSILQLQAASSDPTAPTPDVMADGHAGTYWLPEQASNLASDVDSLYYAILALNIICFVGIAVAVVYFCWKYRYRKGKHEKPLPSPTHNDALEITWTIIPSIIVVIIFVAGWKGYVNLATPPRKAMEIKVTGKKWAWNFEYKVGPNDAPVSSAELHVPVNRPVRLVMTSQDVIHSFFVPAFRVKQDVLPARYTYLWFTATKPGTYRLYCAEYCGTNHSKMLSKVVVHDSGGDSTYQDWLEENSNLEGADLGKARAALCIACHSIDGTKLVGPSFKGLFGKEETMTDGSKVTVDENYLRESIEDPAAKVVQGYQPVMPTFKGQLSEKEIDGLIEYIKSLK